MTSYYEKENRKEAEKIAERQLIIDHAKKLEGEAVKLQGKIDDGGTDGFIKIKDKEWRVEARRKGYPNHSGEYTDNLSKGWDTKCLMDGGIYINQTTLEHHLGKGFIYIVEIRGSIPRCCFLSPSRIEELLKQPRKMQQSTNSKRLQSVKGVPVKWFKIINTN